MIIEDRFPSEFDASIVDAFAATPDYEFVAGGAGGRSIQVLVDPWVVPAWSASFAASDPGIRALSALHGTPLATGLCVVERGTAFVGDVLDPASGFDVVDTGGPVVAAAELASENVLLLLTPWEITAIDADGIRWRSERIAIEGLRVDEASDGWIRGVADPRDVEPRDFAVELSSGRILGGAGIA